MVGKILGTIAVWVLFAFPFFGLFKHADNFFYYFLGTFLIASLIGSTAFVWHKDKVQWF